MGKKRVLNRIKPTTIFGQKLREHRRAAGMTRYSLAKAADVDPAYLGQLEIGNKMPGWEVACRIADALAVKLDAFR